jgi:hypothetical protein
MKVWLFVEGESDRIALSELWAKWEESLKNAHWSLKIIPLENKSKFFRKIGYKAAEKLVGGQDDLVVGLPDLYPNQQYANSPYKHTDINELKIVQMELVRKSLAEVFSFSADRIEGALGRFYATAMKHDLEMLLLATTDELRKVLDTSEALGNWRHPVEEQNQTKPPKRIVEDLFRTKKKRSYRETVDSKAVLAKVQSMETILYRNRNELQCPVFKSLLDWIGERTGVPAY